MSAIETAVAGRSRDPVVCGDAFESAPPGDPDACRDLERRMAALARSKPEALL